MLLSIVNKQDVYITFIAIQQQELFLKAIRRLSILVKVLQPLKTQLSIVILRIRVCNQVGVQQGLQIKPGNKTLLWKYNNQVNQTSVSRNTLNRRYQRLILRASQVSLFHLLSSNNKRAPRNAPYSKTRLVHISHISLFQTIFLYQKLKQLILLYEYIFLIYCLPRLI